MAIKILKFIESCFRIIAIISFSSALLLLLYRIVCWLLKNTSFALPTGPSLTYAFIFFLIGMWLAIFSGPLWQYIDKKERLAQGMSGIRNPLEALDILEELEHEDPETVANLSEQLLGELERMKESLEPEVWNSFWGEKKGKLRRFYEIVDAKQRVQKRRLKDLIDFGEKLLTVKELLDPHIRKRIEGAIQKGKLDLENQ